MWFHEIETYKRPWFAKRRNRRQRAILSVNALLSAQRDASTRRLAVFVLASTVIAGIAVLGWLGLRGFGKLLFLENDRFKLVKLDIKSGEVITEDLIREYTNIKEGMNLFGFDIGEVRDNFMRGVHNVKTMEISRRMPDTIKIEVMERTPLARIGKNENLMIDDAGFVFALPGRRQRNEPLITGYRGPTLKPGDMVQGLARDAMWMLDACQKTGIDNEVAIVGIDVRGEFSGRDDAIRLHLADGTKVDFWWRRQEYKGLSPSDDLRERLLFLRAVLRRAKRAGASGQIVDLTLDSYKSHTTVGHG